MPTLVATTSSGLGIPWGSGFTLPRPSGITVDDVVVLVIFAGTGGDDWTCDGFTEIGQATQGLTITVMVGTGFEGAGTWAPASATVDAGTFVNFSATTWADADPAVVIGAFYTSASPFGVFDVPAVTTTTDAAELLAVGHSEFGSQTFDPAMTLVTSYDARQAHRTLAAAGTTGPTTITPSNQYQAQVWVHVALEAVPVAPPSIPLRDGIRLGDSIAEAITLGATAVTSVYQGATKLWRPTDSFLTTTAEGPRGYWDGNPTSLHIQNWEPPFKEGICFTANADIFVHGARWWRPGTSDGINPGNDLHLRFGPDTIFADPSTHSVTFGGVWDPSEAAWLTVLFDDPIEMAEGEIRVLFVNVTTGGEVVVARQAGYFTTPGTSRLGLITTVTAPAGRFQLDYVDPLGDDHTDMPRNTVDAWYWIDPIIEAAT